MKEKNNVKRNKWVFVIISLPLILIVGVSIFWYNGQVYDKEMATKCIQYNPSWLGLIDCYGVVSIKQAWDIKGYYLDDHVHGYELAEIDNLNDYKFQDGYIYVKNREPFTCSITDQSGIKQFCQKLFQDNRLKSSYYSSISDIPLYLVIDTQTGNVDAYKFIDTVPEDEKKFFKG